MTKIKGTSSATGYGNIKKTGGKSGSAGSAFSDILAAAGASTSAAAGASSIAAPTGIGGLLGLQEVSDEHIARQKTIKQGHSLLQSLEAIRQSLLLGMVPIDVLKTLESRLKNQREMTIDPALHSIMDDIELRAAVELAKLGYKNTRI